MSELEDRVGRIEGALVALGVLQFGEGAGHPFRGNQYGEGHPDDVDAYHRAREGGADHAEALDSARRSAAERNARTSGTDPSWYGQ